MMSEEQTPAPRRTRVPDLLVEQLMLGELPPDRAARIRAELETQPGGLERVQQLRQSNEEILIQYPARAVVPFVEKRARVRQRRGRSSLFVLLPALAAGAAAFAFVLHDGHRSTLQPAEQPEVILEKGSPHLRVYRKGSIDTPRLQPGAIVHPHDLLQVAYLAGGKRFGVIFSIDGRGGVTLHYPEQPGQSQTLEGKKEISLGHAYELDDAPAFERFFFIAGNAPIDIDAVLNEARTLASHPDDAARRNLELPEGVAQYSITLRKESP